MGFIGHNPADSCRSQYYIIRLFHIKKLFYRRLVAEVQFRVRPGQNIGKTFTLKFADNRTAHHSAMTGHKYFIILFHLS